jgi:hypothetical protein
MSSWADWINLISAALAAIFWLLSALVRVPDLMETKLSGEGSITHIMQKQSALSATAAVFAAVSVAAQIWPKISN